MTKPRTFADIYCEKHGLARPRYHAHVFQRSLFPHARLLAPIIRCFRRLHFLADHEFVEDVGYITCVADFSLPLGNFIEHPANRGRLRRRFGLRVSARRLLQLVRETFTDGGNTMVFRGQNRTFEPFRDTPPDR